MPQYKFMVGAPTTTDHRVCRDSGIDRDTDMARKGSPGKKRGNMSPAIIQKSVV